MINVAVYKNNEIKFASSFETLEEANNWIDSQVKKGSWGKKEVIMNVTKVEPPMQLIEEVEGILGIKAYKVKIPADYEIVITEEGTYSKERDLEELVKKRDDMLCATDWLFMSDVIVDQKPRRLYMEYRQYLRDLPRALRSNSNIKMETFENFLRRKNPEEFMDGGKADKIINRFMYYIK